MPVCSQTENVSFSDQHQALSLTWHRFFLLLKLHLFLAENLGQLTWVRLQQLQEQCYPFLSVCAPGIFVFWIMVWLPVLGILNMDADVMHVISRGDCKNTEREPALKMVSVMYWAFWSDAVPTELQLALWLWSNDFTKVSVSVADTALGLKPFLLATEVKYKLHKTLHLHTHGLSDTVQFCMDLDCDLAHVKDILWEGERHWDCERERDTETVRERHWDCERERDRADCHWLKPSVCLQREHQRLRKFERDNQQMQERLHTVTAKNEEIKEENSESS